MTVETIFLNSGLAFFRSALTNQAAADITSFRIGPLAGFDTDPDATDVSNTVVYMGLSSQVTTAIDDDDNIVYTISLDETIGTFPIGNIMVFASDANDLESGVEPLLHIILPYTTPKVATVGANVGNMLVIRVTINVIDGSATTTVTINAVSENIGVLPSVPTDDSLPTPGPSVFQQFVVQKAGDAEIPALAIRQASSNTWFAQGNLQLLDDHRLGWIYGGFYTDAYTVTTGVRTIFGGFFETAAPKYTKTIDGGANWATFDKVIDGGTW